MNKNPNTIYTLKNVLSHLQGTKNIKDTIVFLDWDDTLVNPDNDKIIEPRITKQLFDYMLKNKIFFCIITARFWDSVCDDNKRNLFAMQENVEETMHPIIEKLGMNIDSYKSFESQNNYFKVFDEKNECVEILYMGIFFTGNKGDVIKHYSNMIGKKHKVFVDDYPIYLNDVITKNPDIVAFKRMHRKY